jgi:hypothetical protein
MKYALLGVLLSLNAFALKPIGVVKMIKGKVASVRGDNNKVFFLKRGDKVFEDSTLTSHKKSFARINLFSGSSVVIGPDSKMLLHNMKKNEEKIITLMKGKIKSLVDKKDRKHFYIKTESASMGVRGTHFVIGHYPQGSVTSVVTLEGEVGLTKNDTRDEVTDEKMKKILKKPQQIIRAGEFSKATSLISEATPPETIAKEQIKQLEKTNFVDDNTLAVDKVKGKVVHIETGLFFEAAKLGKNAIIKSGDLILKNGSFDVVKGVVSKVKDLLLLNNDIKEQLPPPSILKEQKDPYDELDN